MPQKISMDELFASRQFSVKSSVKGDILSKIYKAPASWNAENRSARFVMTAQVKDRYGDVVMTKGAKLDDFMGNPVGLWGHMSRAFPIGMWSDIKLISSTPKRMEGTINIAPEGTTEDADTVARLLAANMVRACSIGFLPIEWEAIDKEKPWSGYQFNEWELLEGSVCSVPANPAALVKAAGGDNRLALQAIELVLDEWARTPDGLIVPRSKYEETYAVTRNNGATIHEVKAIDEPSVDEPAGATSEILKIDLTAADQAVEGFFARIQKRFDEMFRAAPPIEEPPAPVDPAPLPVDETLEAELTDQLEKDLDLADEQEVLEAEAEALALLSVPA